MGDSAAPRPATAREIILELIRNMREGLEPLHLTTLAPGIFHVFLHPDDLERLQGIAARIIDEATQALDVELAALNRAPLTRRLGIGRRDKHKFVGPDDGWRIELHPNTDDDVEPGDIVIQSELALPPRPEYGAGSMTRRIATGRIGGQASASRKTDEPPAQSDAVYATLEYEDTGGRQRFRMTGNQVVIGRGGRDYWVDLKLNTAPDVSREHARLRRDPSSGKFFLKDMSTLGTTVDGKKIPSSIEVVNGEKRDRNTEVDLPSHARIGLAGVVFLDFQAGSQ